MHLYTLTTSTTGRKLAFVESEIKYDVGLLTKDSIGRKTNPRVLIMEVSFGIRESLASINYALDEQQLIHA